MESKARLWIAAAASFLWSAGLLILIIADLGPAGQVWRLRTLFLVAWLLGLVLLWLAAARGVSARADRGRRAEVITTVDPSTGLANRRAFTGMVQGYLEVSENMPEKSLVMVVSVNDLDRIAQEYGEEEAERVMVLVARALLDSLRGADLLGRYEKDELAAFLPKASVVSWEVIADRIRMNVAEQSRKVERPYDISVSIGHAEFDSVSPRSFEVLIREAYDTMLADMGEGEGGAA